MSTTEISQAKVKKPVIETAIFRLTELFPSGFFQEGTENTANPVEIQGPKWRKVLNRSHYRDGASNVEIRYIHATEEIHVDEQVKKGLVSRINPRRDMVVFKEGDIVAAAEGSGIGLINYLRKASFCGTNPDRDETVPIRWVEIFPEVTRSDVNEKAFEEAEAIALIRSLAQKVDGAYEYNEEKITAYCNLFGSTAESPAGKINTLIAKAKMNPELFLKKIASFDQSFITDIMVAEELGVISIEATSISYLSMDKVLITFPEKTKKEKKVMMLASLFQTFEGESLYREFMVNLNLAKEKNTNK